MVQPNPKPVQFKKAAQPSEDQVEIVFYTDPLCCWSWGFEPQWRKLRYEFEGNLSWRYCMGGLIPSWKNYSDATNSVSRPIQMGPIWMEASHNSGMPINSRIWVQDPPASSYPACIAVKCAEGQSVEAGEKYLRMLREAVMLKGRNISQLSVLVDLATELADHVKFNVDLFRQDLKNDTGLEAFRKDLLETQARNITRFPSLIFRKSNQPSIIITGYRPYPALLEAIHQIAPGSKRSQQCSTADSYIKYWGTVTDKEVGEALARP